MSSCLSGGGRTYGFELEIVKSPSTSTQTLHTSSSSSPSSTLSESSNSPLAISTRKPRTPRKRPNQIYNEAAALLSTAYPNIFSSKHLTKNPCKFTKPHDSFYDESSELLLPFRVIDDLGIPLHHHQSTIQEKSSFRFEPKVSNFIDKSCHQSSSPIEIDSYANSNSNSLILCDGYHQDDDFDAESMLDEEIEEGIIDSIMGNLSVNNNNNNDSVDEYYSNAASSSSSSSCPNVSIMNSCYGYPMPMGLGFGGNFELGFGIRWGLRAALKPVSDEGDWWRFPAVDVGQISPKLNTTTTTTNNNNNNNNNNQVSNLAGKKKKKKMEKPPLELLSLQKENVKTNSELSEEKSSIPSNSSSSLLLKLNFEEVLNAWSDRGSPFSDEIQGSELAGGDIHARLAKIDLCLENGGVREASVLRYKEKRRTRLFSKKIRYQVRKVNADRRPRMKGRFVRRPNSSGSGGLR